MKKKFLGAVFAVLLMLLIVPEFGTQVSASSDVIYADEANANIGKLVSALDGKFFTVSQGACTAGVSGHGCYNCTMSNVVRQPWLKAAVGRTPSSTELGFTHYYFGGKLIGGQSCCGFANFAGWYIFSANDADTVSFYQYKTGVYNSSTMSSARPGDILRFGNSTASCKHSAVFLSADDDGVYVLDSNWSTSGGNCRVTKHKISYSSYYYVTISRASNYEPDQNSVYSYELFLNYSGKNYMPAVSAEAFCSDRFYSRNNTVVSVAADASVRRVDSCDTLKIVNTAAGCNGKDFTMATYTAGSSAKGSCGMAQKMTLSFWAKADKPGTKIYFRWGYEGDYRSVELTDSWAYYTVRMDKTAAYNSNIHPYVDSAGTVWISELQLEEGTAASAFASEYGGLLTSGTAKNGGTYSGLSTPVRSGFTFSGWYTKASGGEIITSSTSVRAGNIRLYAKWTDEHSHNYYNGVCTACKAHDEAGSGFADVKNGAYYYDAVKWAVGSGITRGTSSACFSPDEGCSRAQIVTFLWRAAGSPKCDADVKFSDVRPGSYYYNAVKWAVSNRITKGTSSNTFSPDDECTRAQIAVLLHRAKGRPAAGDTASFSDIPHRAYYRTAVNWAVENNITKGVTKTSFAPNDTCTRAQVAVFLYRAG